jgi:hypothetical protein
MPAAAKAFTTPFKRVINPQSVPQGKRAYKPTHKKQHKAKPKVGKGHYVKAPLMRDKLTQPRWIANAAVNNPGNLLAAGSIGAGGGILAGNKKPVSKAENDRTKNTAAGALIGGGTGHLARMGAGYGAKSVGERQFKTVTHRGNYGPYKEGPHQATMRAHEKESAKAAKGKGAAGTRIKAEHFARHFPKGVPSYGARRTLTALTGKKAAVGAVLGTAAVGAGVGGTRKVHKSMSVSAFGVDHGMVLHA